MRALTLVVLLGCVSARPMPPPSPDAPRAPSWAEQRVAERQKQEDDAAAARAAIPPEVRIRAVSARLCRFTTWRERVVAAIEKEHRYSEEAGVVNLSMLEALKEQLQAIDDAEAAQRQKFIEANRKPDPCGSQKIAAIAACLELAVGTAYRGWSLAADVGADCSSPDVSSALLLER